MQSIYEQSSARLFYRSDLGVDLFVHPQKIIQILQTNQSCDAEPWIRSIEHRILPGSVAIDVGANIGIVSSWLSSRFKQVLAFEPDEQNVELMRENLELNGANNVELIEKAVGNSDGEVVFYRRNSFGHHSTIKNHLTSVVDSVRVPLVKLDTLCGERGIDRVSFLKIDVEGTEIDVLRGFEAYIGESRIDFLLFEHAPVLLERQQYTEVYDFLNNYGYQVYDMSHKPVSRDIFLSGGQGDFYAVPA